MQRLDPLAHYSQSLTHHTTFVTGPYPIVMTTVITQSITPLTPSCSLITYTSQPIILYDTENFTKQ